MQGKMESDIDDQQQAVLYALRYGHVLLRDSMFIRNFIKIGFCAKFC